MNKFIHCQHIFFYCKKIYDFCPTDSMMRANRKYASPNNLLFTMVPVFTLNSLLGGEKCGNSTAFFFSHSLTHSSIL